MPSKLKKRVRSRQAKTGESYTSALQHVRAGMGRCEKIRTETIGAMTVVWEQLPDGALPIYERQKDECAWLVFDEGMNFTQRYARDVRGEFAPSDRTPSILKELARLACHRAIVAIEYGGNRHAVLGFVRTEDDDDLASALQHVRAGMGRCEKDPIIFSDLRLVLDQSVRTGLYDGMETDATPVEIGASKALHHISGEGENIFVTTKGRYVLVDFFRYGFDWDSPDLAGATVEDETRFVDGAIGERIVALLETIAINEVAEYDVPTSWDKAVATLATRVHGGEIGYILVNDAEVSKILPHTGEHRVIASKHVPIGTVFATPSPHKTGGLLKHPDGRIGMYVRSPSTARVFITQG